jgi:citrate transporter
MGLMVIHGAQAGGFSPISIYGGITNGVVEEAGLPLNEIATFLASLFVNLAVAVLLFMVLGGRDLLRRRAEVAERPAGDASEPSAAGGTGDGRPAPGTGPPSSRPPQQGAQAYGDAEMEARTEERELERALREVPEAAPDEQPQPSRAYQLLTVAGILALAALTLFFELDIGFVAITIGLVLTLISPQLQKRAVGQVTWPEILLITGVGTYVGVLDEMGTIDYVGDSVADLASPLLMALLLCFIGAVVSAFASSTAVLGS